MTNAIQSDSKSPLKVNCKQTISSFKSADNYYKKALCSISSENFIQALSYFDQALALEPKGKLSGRILISIGNVYFIQRNFQLALDIYKQAEATAERHLSIFNQILLFIDSGNFQKAHSLTVLLKKEDPGHRNIQAVLGTLTFLIYSSSDFKLKKSQLIDDQDIRDEDSKAYLKILHELDPQYSSLERLKAFKPKNSLLLSLKELVLQKIKNVGKYSSI